MSVEVTPRHSDAAPAPQLRRTNRQPSRHRRSDLLIGACLTLGLLVSFIPIYLMVNISGKSPGQFLTNPLGLTLPFNLDNYIVAFKVLWRSILNTVLMSVVVVTLSLLTSTLAGFVFARYRFVGSKIAFWVYLSILFIPDVLTFVPRYTLANSLGILDGYWVQILPYVATAQIFQIVVMRSFFSGIPNEIFEAAAMDGAGILRTLWSIAIPMSRPILVTLGVMRAIGFWDEWVWPSVATSSYNVRPMALQVFYLQSNVGNNVGQQMAGYVIASLPLLVLFVVANKQFVEGLTSGAMKF